MDEAIYSIALTRIPRVGAISAKRIIDVAGSATFVFRNYLELAQKELLKPWLIQALEKPEAYIQEATKIVEQAKTQGLRLIPYTSQEYPYRLKECEDAPTLLYYRGSQLDFNRKRILSIVGTRHMTSRGQAICEVILADLRAADPNILILSGLAYGVDVCAHQQALKQGLDTVGILAHGLDRIYPAAHREIAQKMMLKGGVLSEFRIGTEPDRYNFVSRNRIIAGMSDATLVIESAAKGGSLITADFANMYNRECFAIPGRSSDPYSLGCNQLIKTNKAQLVESADDILEALDWHSNTPPTAQQSLDFDALVPAQPLLSNQEQALYTYLSKNGQTQINDLLVALGLPINELQTLLFELEMKGVIVSCAGGVYKLC